ncbi:unnamed protein product (mitochondrion) [Plasmodiophora brassicae]|uniref:Uncharacterized protein n=1 Tax=Plasmodiophora brassicae TaxID=37360 RepID=A0A3P3Y4P4_PLABS|nr:unnamed protein product [Plasmodiophora brassicae]
MANQFRELDTIDFFVDKENEGGASTDPSSSAYTSADDDDVLVDRQNTMQWPNDATMRRRTRPPPMIRKPKPASRPSTASSTLNGASKGIFSATFNMYLTKPSSAAPAEAHLANAGPSLKRAETASVERAGSCTPLRVPCASISAWA